MSPCPSLWTVKGSTSPKVRPTSSKQVQGTCPPPPGLPFYFENLAFVSCGCFFWGGILCFLVLACFLDLYVFGSALFLRVQHLAVFSTENKSEYKIYINNRNSIQSIQLSMKESQIIPESFLKVFFTWVYLKYNFKGALLSKSIFSSLACLSDMLANRSSMKNQHIRSCPFLGKL